MIKTLVLGILGAALVAAGAMVIWRAIDRRADGVEMARLLALQPADPQRFSPTMIAHLPEPARRFLSHAIAEGTPLRTVARIEMTGRFALGTQAAPGYIPMTATQVLAAPQGFVWQMRGGAGLMRVSGSDSGTWTRFWAAGLLPVARMGGDPDHALSAFGRAVSEAILWTPATVLPGPGVIWDAPDADTARVTVTEGAWSITADLSLDAEGRATQVVFQRWSNANAGRVWRFQPFGAILSDYREFGGFRVPTHVEAGNLFGTPDYFPFFIAEVRALEFPSAPR